MYTPIMSVSPEVLAKIQTAWKDTGVSYGYKLPSHYGSQEEPANFFTEDQKRRFSVVNPIVSRAMSDAIEDIKGLPYYRIETEFVDPTLVRKPAVLYTARMFERIPTEQLPEVVIGDKSVSLLYTPGKDSWFTKNLERFTVAALAGVETPGARELSEASFITYQKFMEVAKKNIATIPAAAPVIFEWDLEGNPEFLREAVFNLTRIGALKPRKRYNSFTQPFTAPDSSEASDII